MVCIMYMYIIILDKYDKLHSESVMWSLHFTDKPQPPPAAATPPQAGPPPPGAPVSPPKAGPPPEANGMIIHGLCLPLYYNIILNSKR